MPVKGKSRKFGEIIATYNNSGRVEVFEYQFKEVSRTNKTSAIFLITILIDKQVSTSFRNPVDVDTSIHTYIHLK